MYSNYFKTVYTVTFRLTNWAYLSYASVNTVLLYTINQGIILLAPGF